MRVLSPAKINIHLRVGPRRPDGFHPLLSWMATVGLFDTLNFTPLHSTGGAPPGHLSLRCDNPLLPCDQRNLVVKIANALREESKPDFKNAAGLQVYLEKRIPVGAGLGGGSSNGAFTLMALNRLWNFDPSGSTGAADVLSAFAARFGSDLSFFFHGPSAVCRGRGEIVSPVARPSARWAVLVLPKLSMPTPDVYRKFDQMNLGRDEDITNEPDWNAWTKLKSEELLPGLVNDLEPPAFDIAPALGRLRSRIERILARPVRMSGSGSSLFTLFDDQSHAADAAEKIERDANEKAVPVEVAPILNDDLQRE